MSLRAAIWACLLAIFAPRRFHAFQENHTIPLGIPAAGDEDSIKIVSRAFWLSLILVLSSGAIGAGAGWALGAVASANPTGVTVLQITGAGLLLWGTLFIRGWEIQTWKGQTLIERVNRWIYRGLYCWGTAILVASLTWPIA